MMGGCKAMLEGLVVSKKADPSIESPPPIFIGNMKNGQIAELESLESQLLDQAEFFLQKKDYTNSLNSVKKSITCCGGHFSDRTLHILATVLEYPENLISHRNDSITCFKWLEASFPDSVYGPASRCWVAVVNEFWIYEAEILKMRTTIQSQLKKIQFLESQIEQLKAVDLELETLNPDDEAP